MGQRGRGTLLQATTTQRGDGCTPIVLKDGKTRVVVNMLTTLHVYLQFVISIAFKCLLVRCLPLWRICVYAAHNFSMSSFNILHQDIFNSFRALGNRSCACALWNGQSIMVRWCFPCFFFVSLSFVQYCVLTKNFLIVLRSEENSIF